MAHDTQEIERNYEAFQRYLPNLLQSAPGRFALLHSENVIEIFDTSVAAVINGMRTFGPGKYSVQEITGQAENLGFYSYAGGTLQA